MDPYHLAKVFAQSILLGALIGLQRERAKKPLAGIRTFPMIAAMGTVCAVLAKEYSPWVLAAGLIVMGAYMVGGAVLRWRLKQSTSTTTQMAMLLTFGLGAMLLEGPAFVAIAVGVVMAALLQYKPELHGIVERLQNKDVYAVVQFTLITFVILPVLPDQTYGPFEVINPRQVWWMVVLISGMSLASYAALKVFGGRYGTLASGVIGGMVSSTATTLTLARRSKQGESPAMAAAAIMAASGIVFVRVAVIVAFVDRSLLMPVLVPSGALLAVGLIVAAILAFRTEAQDVPLPEVENPCELRFALVFAAMYAVVLFFLAAGRHYLGESGIYVVSAVSGLTDMDAIAISVARLQGQGDLVVRTAVRAIIIAGMANMVFKTGLVASLGDRALLKRAAVGFGILFVAGAVAVALV